MQWGVASPCPNLMCQTLLISHGKPCPLGIVDREMFWGTGVGNEVCEEEMWMEYKMKLKEKNTKMKMF